MRRGEVWWASLPMPDGSGPGLRRPVLIVQSNPFNESRIATVIVAVITFIKRSHFAGGDLTPPLTKGDARPLWKPHDIVPASRRGVNIESWFGPGARQRPTEPGSLRSVEAFGSQRVAAFHGGQAALN